MHNFIFGLSGGCEFVTLRWHFSIVALTLMASLAVSGCGGQQSTRATWTGATMDYHEPYGVLPVEPAISYSNQTLRQVVDTAAGGYRIRMQLSNRYGTLPLILDAVHVAVSAGEGSIDSSTDVGLTFKGQPGVTIPVGQEIWSDMTTFALKGPSNLAVSLHIPGAAPLETIHGIALHTSYTAAGNAVSQPSLTTAQAGTYYAWISGVDVSSNHSGPVIVSIGASVSEGAGSSIDTDGRYTDYLQQRLSATSDLENASVVNAGLAGNRLLHNGIGVNLLARFTQDALAQSGVSHVIVLCGTDDIAYGNLYIPGQAVRRISWKMLWCNL